MHVCVILPCLCSRLTGPTGQFMIYYQRLRFLVEAGVEAPTQTIFQTVVVANVLGSDPGIMIVSIIASVFSLLKNVWEVRHTAKKLGIPAKQHLNDLVSMRACVRDCRLHAWWAGL